MDEQNINNDKNNNNNDNIMFKFAGIKYPNQMQKLSNPNKHHYKKILTYACGGVSLLWFSLIMAYASAIFSSYPAADIPLFLTVSLFIISVFPIALIWGGYVIYHHILQAQETGVAILEAARVLASPALVAASDVQTLSSAVAEELNNLRHGLRDIEDRVHHASKMLSNEVSVLNDAGEHLNKSIENISHKIFNERDSIIDLMKVIKNEKRVDSVRMPVSSGEINPETVRNQNPHQVQNIEQDIEAKVNMMVQSNYNQQNTPQDIPQNTDYDDVPPRKPVSFSLSDIQPLNESPENYILRTQRQLYEGLYAITVDLNRVLGTNAPQELWPRYMRGDRNVFAEYFCHWIEQHYESYRDTAGSDDFRKIANRFVSQFETLRERLFDTPHAEVSEYLERSGIGRIYNLMIAEYA
jgi:hypothetical protein